MRKAIIAVIIVMMVSAVSAATAVISPSDNSLQEIELNSSNSYEVEKQFDGSGSSPDSVTYSWSWTEESISKKGPTANFTFDRDNPQDNTIKLVVTSASDSDDESVSFSLRDQPEIKSTSVSDTDVDLNNSDGEVDYSVVARNEFDDPISYEWTFSNGTTASTNANFTVDYDSTGDYKLTVNLTDDKGYYATKTVEKVDVTESESEEEQSGGGAGSGEEDSFDERYIMGDISAGDSKDASFSDSPVTDVNIEFGEDVEDTELESKAQESLPDDTDEEPSDDVFEYIELKKTNFTNDDIDSVDFDFEVEKDWVEDNYIKEDSIALQRYEEDSWEKLSTTKEDESSNYLYFSADSPGLSVFSITGEGKEADIEVTGISLSSSEIDVNQTMDIDIAVENLGDRAGDRTISFELAGEDIEEEVNDLSPGNTVTITVSKQFKEDGNYDVELDGESASFTVGDPVSTTSDTTEDNSNNQSSNETVEDSESDEDGGFPIIVVSLLVVLIGVLAAVVAYLYTHEERREEVIRTIESFTDNIGDSEEEKDDEFEWDGFDK